MAHNPTARIAGPDDPRPSGSGHGPSPLRAGLVVASVGPRTPRLTGADWIRIDGGQPLVEAEQLRERHAPCPALFDVPGPDSARYRNLLTTTESLVFAATSGFGWVNLRDLEDPADLERARTFLDDQTRLSCTVAAPWTLQRSLDSICRLGDALLLDLTALARQLPPSYCGILCHAVIKRAREHDLPVLLIPSTTARGAAAELGRIGQLLAAGAHGLVLTSETTHNPRAQEAVDLARALVDGSSPSAVDERAQRSARLGPDDDASGWITLG